MNRSAARREPRWVVRRGAADPGTRARAGLRARAYTLRVLRQMTKTDGQRPRFGEDFTRGGPRWSPFYRRKSPFARPCVPQRIVAGGPSATLLGLAAG